MKKKKVMMRIPSDAHKKLEEKQQRMSKIYERLTGKKKKIPLTRIIDMVAAEPIYLDDQSLINFFGKKRRRKI